jgi:branched-chain amino acid transport system ATP-binding protein
MLSIKNLSVRYGGIHALREISFDVPAGEIVTLIGANGAGKSTTLNAIVGLVKADGGSVSWNGREILNGKTKNIVESGVVLVPEGRRVFPNLNVDENLYLGAYSRKNKAEIEADLEHVFGLFPRLKERHKQKAGTLSGGEQQMLAVGRALMSRPKVLMMDEPSLGLAPIIVGMIFDIIRQINAEGVTVLLVEQNAKAALQVANTGYVMETGKICFSGSGKDLLADDRIRKAYLGEH